MKVYHRLLRAAALPILDRKWAAPLSAVALGFGLFAGVAIGPGAAGTLATGATQIVEVPGLGALGDSGDSAEEESSRPSPPAEESQEPGGSSSESFGASSSSFESPLPLGESESGSYVEPTEAPELEPEAPPPTEEDEPEGETLKGVVVHLNEAAGSYTVASKGGAITAVHASKAPAAGTQVKVPIAPLANGTYSEAGKRVKLGEEEEATISGIVTYVDPDPADPAYTVSKRGASMLVHVRPDPTGAAPDLPEVGAFANVAVEIEAREPSTEVPGAADEPPAPVEATVPDAPTVEPPTAAAECTASTELVSPSAEPEIVLWQRHLEAEGTPLTYGDFGGIVTAVCPESNQLLLSADDLRESEEDLLFEVPGEEIDLLRLQVGSPVLATATIAADGKLSLTGLAGDEKRKGADDEKALQGDLGES